MAGSATLEVLPTNPEISRPASAGSSSLPSSSCDIVSTATPSSTVQKRGLVARRRFQKGTFVKKPNGSMFSMYYTDAVGPDGLAVTKQVKQFLGNLAQISQRAARREHALIMERINQQRGSLRPVPKGQTFADAVKKWCLRSHQIFRRPQSGLASLTCARTSCLYSSGSHCSKWT